MSFAMCLGGEIILAFLVVLLAAGGACLALAVFATVGLARWAAARHNRIVANQT